MQQRGSHQFFLNLFKNRQLILQQTPFNEQSSCVESQLSQTLNLIGKRPQMH